MTALGSKIWSPGDWLSWKGELGRLVTMRKPALSHATMRVYLPLFCLIILIDNQPCWVPALIKPSRVQSQDMEETVCASSRKKDQGFDRLFLQHRLFESSFRLGFWESDMRKPPVSWASGSQLVWYLDRQPQYHWETCQKCKLRPCPDLLSQSQDGPSTAFTSLDDGSQSLNFTRDFPALRDRRSFFLGFQFSWICVFSLSCTLRLPCPFCESLFRDSLSLTVFLSLPCVLQPLALRMMPALSQTQSSGSIADIHTFWFLHG